MREFLVLLSYVMPIICAVGLAPWDVALKASAPTQRITALAWNGGGRVPGRASLFNAILNEIRVAESALAAMTAERDEIAGKASTMVVRAMAAEDALEQAVADRDAAREQRDNLAAALASGSAQKEGE